MAQDARIAVSFPSHPKTKKLIRRLGPGAAWHLVCLFLWVAQNKPDGDLTGMSDEDIELAVDWMGEEGIFVAALVAVGFLDGDTGSHTLHDWAEHNPYAAGSEGRSDHAKKAASVRWNRQYGSPGSPRDGCSEHQRAMPDDAQCMQRASTSNAPSPYPTPTPDPYPTPKPTRSKNPRPAGLDSALFAQFWSAYPRHENRPAAEKAFAKLQPDSGLVGVMLAAIDQQREGETWRGGFIPHPASWLNGKRWEDEIKPQAMVVQRVAPMSKSLQALADLQDFANGN